MSKIKLTGSNSGYVEIDSAADAGNLTLTLPTSGARLLSNTDNVFSGITTTAELDINGKIDVSTDIVGGRNLKVTGITTLSDDLTLTGASYNVVWDKSDNQLEFGDNAKISFGGQADMQLFHDGSHSYIKDAGTGNLYLMANTKLQIDNAAANKTMASFIDGGAVELYFNNSKKIETTNTGAVVTGICTATSFSGSGANLTGLVTPLSFRNLVINGAMRIAQRATSSTTSGYGDLDRWKHEYAGTNENPTFAQSDVVSSDVGDNPFAKGITKCIKITNGNQTSGLQGSSQINFNQQIEAQDVRNSGWNYNSSSSYITLSYYVKSSVSQNFSGFVKTADGTNYIYPFETGSLSADNWTKITKTIPGASNLQIDNDTGSGFQIFPVAIYGTNLTDNATNYNQWATWNSSMRSKDQATSWFTTNDATLEITGVQLEVSSVATPFEHRSYGEELNRCLRYYWKWGYSGGTTSMGIGMAWASSEVDVPVQFPVPMRTAPTISDQGTGADYYYIEGAGSSHKVDGNWTLQFGSPYLANIYATPDGSLTAGNAHHITMRNSAAYVAFSAEI